MTPSEVQQKISQAVTDEDWAELRKWIADGDVDHDPAANQGPGPDGFVTMFSDLKKAFPDRKTTVVTSIETEDHLCIASEVTGTHLGEFLGHAPTGKSFTVRSMQISRFADDKLVERWGASDYAGILHQLGITS